MDPKTLDVTNMDEVTKKVSDVKVFGDPGVWVCLCKASSESEGWMKSTKVMTVPGGKLYQVSTQQLNIDGTYAVAEALAFVPDQSPTERLNTLLKTKADVPVQVKGV